MRYLHGLSLCLWLAVSATAAAEDFVGIIHPLRDLTLSLGIGGVVASVDVKVGQKVQAGQLLLTLDDRMQVIETKRRKVVWEDQSELQAVESRLGIIKRLYENARVLYEKTGGISRDELEKLKLELISTEGRIDQLRAQEQREQLEYQGAEQERNAMRLLAPSDGVVTRIEVEVGEWNKPGEAVLQLVDSSSCYLNVSVSRRAASRLNPGMQVPVLVPGRNKAIAGRLTFVSPVADAASGLVELRVVFDNPRGQVRPGATGRIQLSTRGAGNS